MPNTKTLEFPPQFPPQVGIFIGNHHSLDTDRYGVSCYHSKHERTFPTRFPLTLEDACDCAVTLQGDLHLLGIDVAVYFNDEMYLASGAGEIAA